MDPNNISTVTDYVLRVREQDGLLYGLLLTVLIGTILGGILISLFKKERAEKGTPIWALCCSLVAFVCFMTAIYFMRVKHIARGEFCVKWMANNAAVQSTPKELIGKFSKDYYSFVVQGEPNYPCDPNNVPDIFGAKRTQTFLGHFFGIDILLIAAFVLFLVCMLSPLKKTQSDTAKVEINDQDLQLLDKAITSLIKTINLLKGKS
jgi:hypothetical protein